MLVVELRRRPDDLLVLRQARVPLARVAAEEAVEVVEAPAVRPAVERPGRTLLAVGRQVPLPERGRAVAVVAEDPRQRSAVPWQRRGVAGEAAGELADRAEADGVVVAPGQQRRPGRGAQCGDVEAVVAEPLLSQPCVVRRADGTAERGRVPEARVVDEDEQHVRGAVRWRRVPDQVPVGLRTLERSVCYPLKRRPSDRESGAVDVCHGHPPQLACEFTTPPAPRSTSSSRGRPCSAPRGDDEKRRGRRRAPPPALPPSVAVDAVAPVTQPATPAATAWCAACWCSACSSSWACGLRSKTTFLTVPVKAYGALSS